jgi:tetratricopeptide (TPR) repeat protein
MPDQPLESSLAVYYPLLVYHWHQAEDKERERFYARLAGAMAAAQFANAEAVSYFSRALELTPKTEFVTRYELLLAREAVNDLRAEREAQAEDLEALAALAERLADDRRRAEVNLGWANYAEAISDYPAALAAARPAVEQAVRAGDRAAEAEGYIIWGKALWRQGEYDAAREPLEQALALAGATNNRPVEAKSLYYLGHAYLYQNNYPEAQARYRQALEIYRIAGHRQGEADSLNILGVTYYELGDFSTARDYYEQVLTIFHKTGDRRGETIVLSNLGNVYCDLGDYDLARDYQEQALNLRRMIGDRWGEGSSLTNLGLVYYGLGDYAATCEHCEQALAIQREIGDRRNVGYSLTYLGHALTGLGKLEAAAAAYAEALHLRRELGQSSLAIDDLAGLAVVALFQGDLVQALARVEEILAWLDAHGPAGIEYPLQVYLTCYQVLSVNADGNVAAAEQTQTILDRAHAALMKQAAGISDADLRHKFLENVKANREIIAAWRTHQAN